MRKEKFTKEHFSFVCPMKWDDMQESANGRFCGKCQQEVVDVSDCSLEEVYQMQRKDPHLCVAIKTLVTAGVALSIAACTPAPPVYQRTAGAPRAPHRPDDIKKQDVKNPQLSVKKANCALPDKKPNLKK